MLEAQWNMVRLGPNSASSLKLSLGEYFPWCVAYLLVEQHCFMIAIATLVSLYTYMFIFNE
jgi:hypothetical protein